MSHGLRHRLRLPLAGLIISALVCASVTLSEPELAVAASYSVGATLGQGTVDTYVSGARRRGSTQSGGRKRSAQPAPPRMQYLQLPDCPGNSPSAQETVSCDSATASCPHGQQRLVVFEAPLGTPLRAAGWTNTGSGCRDPQLAHVGEVVIPRLTGSELRRLPLPAGTSAVEPATGYALVNMPTNVYSTSPEPAVLHTTTMGLAVTIRLYPSEFEWDFGDGTVIGPTSDPGGPYPNLANAHTYRAAGRYAITMRTTYRGDFSVNGGAFQPITGHGEVASAPVPLEILTGTGQLQAPARDRRQP